MEDCVKLSNPVHFYIKSTGVSYKLPIIFMFLGTAFQEVAALPFLFDPSWTLVGLACTSLLPALAGTASSVKQNFHKKIYLITDKKYTSLKNLQW
jgi:hypothetical protein